MAIEKLVPQYLNQDDDERLVKPFEMTDALNVRVSHDANGDSGIVKNVEGNTLIAPRAVADTVPSSGGNKVIGVLSSESGRCVYYFLYNSLGSHGIYKYSTVGNDYQKVYENDVLNFSSDSVVQASLVFNKNADHLLYFTDGRNEPKKINVTKALNSGYSPLLASETDSIASKYVTVCRQPPQTPITHVFGTEPQLVQNNLKENIFQFTYQYVYDDGEVSALAMYSRLAISNTHFSYNAPQRRFDAVGDNQLTLTLTNSDGPVDKIRVFARRNNDSTFFKVAEVDNTTAPTQDVVFLNDGIYTVLSSEESTKIFDSVPRAATAQTFSNNRIFYGNYLDGFDNLEEVNVYGYPIYDRRQGIVNADLTMGTVSDLTHQVLASGESSDMSGFYTRAYSTVNGISQVRDGIGGWAFGLDTGEEATDNANYKDLLGLDAKVTMFNQEGTSVSLDTSNFSAIDLDSNLDITSGFSVSAKELAVSAIHPTNPFSGVVSDAFSVPVTITHDNFDGGVLNKTIRMFNPKCQPNASGGAGHAATLELTPGGINDLILGQGFSFEANTTVSSTTLLASDNPIETLANAIGEAYVGKTAIVNVDNNGAAYAPRYYATDAAQYDLPVRIRWQGSVSFTVASAVYVPSENSISLNIQLSAVNLEAEGASAGNPSLGGTSVWQGSADNDGPVDYTDGQISASLNSSNTNAQGFTIADSSSATYTIFHAMRGVNVYDDYIDLSGSRGQRSFKAGASHELGIVYYDHRNRCGGVQKAATIDVPHFGNDRRYGRNGRTRVDLRVMHDPPYWATKWAPVYSKNTSYDKFVQMTVAEAVIPNAQVFSDILASIEGNQDRPVVGSVPAAALATSIFLSTRGLEGKRNSYKEAKGALIDYKYEEGDVLRVLEYTNETGAIVRPLHEFKISGYEYFANDDTNPVQLSEGSAGTGDVADSRDDYRRTGWFLVIADSDIPRFDRLSVTNGTDFFSQNCLVEIFNPKKNVEDKLFYEVGEQRDIVTVANALVHEGDRVNSGLPTFSIYVTETEQFTSAQRMFIGDRVEKAGATASGYFFISGVHELSPNNFLYSIDASNPFTSVDTAFTGVNVNADSLLHGVINIDEGDTYLKTRTLLVNPLIDYTPQADTSVTLTRSPVNPQDQNYDKFMVESPTVSDFFESKCYDTGRPHIETPDQSEIRRATSITYSEPMALDSSRLNLSSFNPVLFPFKDYAPHNGSIQYLGDQDESLLMLQEKKTAFIPVSRTLIQDAGGGQLVTSTNVLGTESYIGGSYGVGLNPESVIERFGNLFFCDLESGRVIAVTGNSVSPISEQKMESYFETTFRDYIDRDYKVEVPCGLDPENNEFVVTMNSLVPVEIVIGGDDFPGVAPVRAITTSADFTAGLSAGTDAQVTWDVDPVKWNYSGLAGAADSDFHLTWSDAGRGVIFVDRLKEQGSAVVEQQDLVVGASFYIDIVSSDYRYRTTGLISCIDGSVALPTVCLDTNSGTDADDAITITTLTTVPGETIAYSTSKNFWLTKYSFIPERYANVHNRFFSFLGGLMYRHNVNTTRNNFYGDAYNSMVKIVSRGNPSMVKVFNAISLESTDAWAATVANASQTTDITVPMYTEKEGMFYSVVPKDITVNAADSSGSHIISLGEVASVTGNDVTFTSRVSNLPFGIGDAVSIITGGGETSTGLTVSAVKDRKTLTLSGSTSGIPVSSNLISVSPDEINGDDIRSYFAALTLTNSLTTESELFAVNTVYTPSPIHNDRQSQ